MNPKTVGTILMALVLCLSRTARLRAESPFAVVFIDAKTEQQYGEYPLDRKVVAAGVEKIKRLKPKAVILKFFYDLPKDPDGDRALAKSISGVPVLLQARLDDSEKNPNRLADRFFLSLRPGPSDNSISGESGWIPLDIISANAVDVGFVDMLTPDKVPMLEKYQGKYVKSLYLCAMEWAIGAKAQISPGKEVKIGSAVIRMDEQNQVEIQLPAKDELNYIGFHDVLAGKATAQRLEGKVVVVGYDGTKIDAIDTARGKVRLHRLFFYGLQSLYTKTRS